MGHGIRERNQKQSRAGVTGIRRGSERGKPLHNCIGGDADKRGL
nr:MAG TPA: hypothetical protein [Caudoviricetes sp.]